MNTVNDIPRARKDAVLPFSKPVIGEDGRELSDVFLPAGTMVLIAVMNANRNKEIWGEDAGEWKPERWLAPLPETVAEAHVPGAWRRSQWHFMEPVVVILSW